MAVVKKLQKSGNSSTIFISSDMRALLNLEHGDEIAMEVVGDTLLVRKKEAPPIDGVKVLAGMEAMKNTAASGSDISEGQQRFWLMLRALAPVDPGELAVRLGMHRVHVRKLITDGIKAGEIVETEEGFAPATPLGA